MEPRKNSEEKDDIDGRATRARLLRTHHRYEHPYTGLVSEVAFVSAPADVWDSSPESREPNWSVHRLPCGIVHAGRLLGG